MTRLTSLLVGMHFRPPAKQVLENLPQGTELTLSPESENPYDEFAIKVLVSPKAVPESQWDGLRQLLPSCGADWDELLASDEPIFLGYIAATGGKPLKGTDYQGNQDFHEAMKAGPDWTARLGFDLAGKALVTLQSVDPAA